MRDKILKCLELSASDNDHEALNAIRMANKLLKAQKLSWAEFLRTTPAAAAVVPKSPAQNPTPQDPWAAAHAQQQQQYGSYMGQGLGGSFNDALNNAFGPPPFYPFVF